MSNNLLTDGKCERFARSYTNRNIELFKTKLKDISWVNVMSQNDCQTAYTLFHEKFLNAYDECFPNKKVN